MLGITPFVQVGAASREERRVLDGWGLGPAIEVIRNRHAGLSQIDPRIPVPHEHQPVGGRIRQRPQQNLIEEAEDRRVRPDPERQRQNSDEREDGLLPQCPQRVAKVLHARLDES